MFFVEYVLYRLHVGVGHRDCNMQFGRGILHHIVDMVIDIINLAADSYCRGIRSIDLRKIDFSAVRYRAELMDAVRQQPVEAVEIE